MARKRALKKTKESLPRTPEKKAELLQKIASSPRTRNVLVAKGSIRTPDEEKEVSALKAMAADISEGVEHMRKTGSKDNRAAYTSFKSVASGENVAKGRAKKSLSKLVNVNAKRMKGALGEHSKIFTGERKSWLYTERKTRGDAISEDLKQLIFHYWTHDARRPTGDKKDIMRQRVDRKEYVEHAKHVLEKSQTEAFIDFKTEYPDVQIKQRKFEALKPFFEKAAKEKDRRSCLCRKHVEIQIVFKDCIKFHKSALQNSVRFVLVTGTVTEAVNVTLCPKLQGSPYHNLKCLERQCPVCGVSKSAFLPEELLKDGPATKWRRYNYIGTGKFLSNGQEKKKIALITKETHPMNCFHIFQVFLKIIHTTVSWLSGSLNRWTIFWSICLLMKPHVYMISQRATVVDNRMKFSPNTLMLRRFLFIFLSCIAMQSTLLMEGKAQKMNLSSLRNISLLFLMILHRIMTLCTKPRNLLTST